MRTVSYATIGTLVGFVSRRTWETSVRAGSGAVGRGGEPLSSPGGR